MGMKAEDDRSETEIRERAGEPDVFDDFLTGLMDAMETTNCGGDFKNSRQVLTTMGLSSDKQAGILKYMEERGGHCDCGILMNVAGDIIRDSEEKRRASA
jgi:hypothetical protein